MRAMFLCFAVLLAGIGASAFGAIANFDDLEEGFYEDGPLTNGGITFYDVDWRMPGSELPEVPPFTIDDVHMSRLENAPDVTMPNVLSNFAYTINGLWYSRWGSMSMTTGNIETYGSIDVHATIGPDWDLGNVVTLEALRDGVVVASDSVVQEEIGDQHYALSVSGVEFDMMRIIGSGDFQNGCFFAVFDNVVMAPEPTSMALLALGAACLKRRR